MSGGALNYSHSPFSTGFQRFLDTGATWEVLFKRCSDGTLIVRTALINVRHAKTVAIMIDY